MFGTWRRIYATHQMLTTAPVLLLFFLPSNLFLSCVCSCANWLNGISGERGCGSKGKGWRKIPRLTMAVSLVHNNIHLKGVAGWRTKFLILLSITILLYYPSWFYSARAQRSKFDFKTSNLDANCIMRERNGSLFQSL